MEKLMGSEGLWHLVEHIFGYLDYKTVVKCRKVSKLWHESLEWIALVKFLLEFGDALGEYHRYVKRDPEQKVLTIISEWKKGVQNYERTGSIEDLRELKDSLEQSMEVNGKFCNHPIKNAVSNFKLLKFLFSTSYSVEAFHLACESDNVEAVKWILANLKENSGFDLNARNDSRRTAFHTACNMNKTEIVKILLDFTKENDTIDLNARCNYERTAFHLACRHGNTKTVNMILAFSKENGAIDLNARDDNGWTPLHMSCYWDQAEIVQLILDFSKENGGIDLNARDEDGETAFHLARGYGNMKTVKLFKTYENINVPTPTI